MSGKYEEALPVYKRLLDLALKGKFSLSSAHLRLAVVYARLGRKEEASSHLAEALKIRPDLSLEVIRNYSKRFKNPEDGERLMDDYRLAGLPEHPPLPLPDKPSIAVLPFTNMSGDPEQEYFVDGMTDNLIADLSKISGVFVIARNSVFTYKGKPIKVELVGRELGVRHILEGSVQKVQNQVRINAQLIDATTGGHLWA